MAESRPTTDISRVFVGRQREIAERTGSLDEALAGQGRMVALAGALVIGKTRTAEQLVAYAEGKGVNVLWGRCYEEEGTPS